MKKLFALILLSVLGGGPALADGAIVSLMTAADKAKLEAFDATRAKALADARAGAAAADLAELDKAMTGAALPLRNVDLTGAWRCRVIKVGRKSEASPPLVVYPWFSCRISEDDAGAWLDKLTGSQRTRGLLYDDGDTRAIYLGALYYGDEKPNFYGRGAAERNQVAYVQRTGAKKLRFEFPSPEFESLLDVMELERK